MKRGLQWPIGIALVLALTVASNVWMAFIASSDEAFAVEPDYYRKAVHFDDEMALRAESARLGWQVAPSLQLGTGTSPGAVAVVVRDALGAAVNGASVQLIAMHNARAAHPLQTSLVFVADGRYEAPLEAQRPGEWELRLTVTRGSDRYAVRTRVDAGPAAR